MNLGTIATSGFLDGGDMKKRRCDDLWGFRFRDRRLIRFRHPSWGLLKEVLKRLLQLESGLQLLNELGTDYRLRYFRQSPGTSFGFACPTPTDPEASV